MEKTIAAELLNAKEPTGVFNQAVPSAIPADQEPLITPFGKIVQDKKAEAFTGKPKKTYDIKYDVHLRIFDLSNEEDIKEIEKIYQEIADGKALISEERTEFNNGKYITYLRWVYYEIIDLRLQEEIDEQGSNQTSASRR